MPQHFKFVDPQDERNILPLWYIDEEMCNDLDIPCDPDHYCMLFQMVTIIGCSPRVQGDDRDGSVDKTKLMDYLDRHFPEFTQKERDLTIKYLCDDYKFIAWYSIGK